MNGPQGADRLVRAALATSVAPTKVAFAVRAVMNGLWLGVLSDDQLRALDELHHADQDRYRQEAWNRGGLFDWEAELVGTHLRPGGSICVVGAGGGREVLALRERGFDAVGFESHPALAAWGARFLAGEGHPGRLRPAPRDELPAGDGTWDAVLIGWGTYSLVRTSDARRALLERSRANLSSGGRILLSHFARPAQQREARWTHTIANLGRRARRRAPIELGDTLSPTFVHLFAPGEVAAEARAAGLDVVLERPLQSIEAGLSYAAAVLEAPT
jgi:hypothetical protein